MGFLLPPKLLLFQNLDYCAGLNFSFIKNLSNPFPVYTLYCSKCNTTTFWKNTCKEIHNIIQPKKKIPQPISHISYRTRITRMIVIQKRISNQYGSSLMNNDHPHYPNPIGIIPKGYLWNGLLYLKSFVFYHQAFL